MYQVTAKQYGNSVTYTADANGPKEALQQAKTKARDIFGWKAGDAEPTVSVKEIVEKD
jgi:hypothetical protein